MLLLSLCASVLLAPDPFASVSLLLPDDGGALSYAAHNLAERAGCELRLGERADSGEPGICAGLLDDPALASLRSAETEALSEEGYAWRREGERLLLGGRTPQAVAYGLLELAELLRDGEPIPQARVTQPMLELRGDWLDLPVYLGCDLYDGRWAPYAPQEASPDSWFHSREYWTRRFELSLSRRVNALVLQHPHPFPAFLEYPDAPEAAWLPPEVTRRNAQSLRQLVELADAFGIRVYLQTWNEWAPRKWAEAHGVPQEGPGTEESAALNRWSYTEMFRQFPGLAGLITMAGESPPGCVDFVRRNIVEPLAALPNPPEIVFWPWCAWAEDVETILDGYPGPTKLMHYLQYEQLFLPKVDPRVGRLSRECGDREVLTLGGLGTATAQLYWADPLFLREMLQTAPGERVGGMFFMGLDSWSWVSNKWIGWEALSRYWWDPFRPLETERAHWLRRIALVTGSEAAAEPLLEAYIRASDVPTRMLCLLHSQSDVFRPQYGLPLVFYLGMPTLSTYVFENHTSIDERGRLAPRMGLIWPNPDWGETVVGVRDWVAAEAEGRAPSGTGPLAIADELEADAASVLADLARLETLAGEWMAPDVPLATTIEQLRMNALLGRHTAAKIRAAVAWERWARGLGPASEVLVPLDESVSAFRDCARVAESLYPGKYNQVRRNWLSKPPPWSHLDLWNNYRFEPDYRFSEWAERFARERQLIADSLAAGRRELPYEGDLVPPVRGSAVAGWSAERGASGGVLLNSYPPKATAEARDGRVVCDFAGSRSDFYFPISSDPATLRLERGRRYEVVLRYEITRVGAEAPLELSFGARTTEGTWRRDVGARYFSGPAGTTGEIRTQFTPADFDDYYVYLSMNGDGAVEVESLSVVRAE